jgi:acyl-CoA thioester hydrolase
MLTITRTCLPQWVDYNGHMRDAYYVLVVSFANDQTTDELGLGPTYLKRTGCTVYNLDTRIRYLKEAHEGDLLRVEMRLLDHDAKKLHLHSLVRHDESDAILAVNESVLLHVDQKNGPKALAFPPSVADLVHQRFERDKVSTPELRVGDVGLIKS